MKDRCSKILLLDNYDSFTYNLYDYLLQIGLEVVVYRNDELDIERLNINTIDGIVLSPGPGRPKDAGCLMQLIAKTAGQLPILGVCLGYQALGEFFGAKLTHALKPIHGKVDYIKHLNTGCFKELTNPMQVMRYHSLVLKSLPIDLEPAAWTNEKELMAFQHKTYPICGVQFHPESIQTLEGLNLLLNWANQHFKGG
jgi:anthranilate synthase/aminodeoxychorismate synthase-like glutamine amidotransferase